MTAHINKNHAGEEDPILLKKERSADSSEGDS